MNDQHFKKLLDALQLTWSGYFRVRKGVKKRIRRHLQLLECRDIEQYLRLLAVDLEVRQECQRLLTVSISRWFATKRSGKGLPVVCGCSCRGGIYARPIES